MTLSPTETLSKTVQGDSRYVLHLMQPNSSAAGSHQQPSTASSQPKPQRDQVTVVNVDNSTPRSYTILKEVGDGSFGTVWLADWHSPLDLPPGTLPPGPSNRPEYKGKKLVAIKRMKKAFLGGWSECLKLKELYVGPLSRSCCQPLVVFAAWRTWCQLLLVKLPG